MAKNQAIQRQQPFSYSQVFHKSNIRKYKKSLSVTDIALQHIGYQAGRPLQPILAPPGHVNSHVLRVAFSLMLSLKCVICLDILRISIRQPFTAPCGVSILYWLFYCYSSLHSTFIAVAVSQRSPSRGISQTVPFVDLNFLFPML